ncbi:lysozyme [Lewinellaceae bacterium SD302]|nr:lysozyme [Lewinellaceae bacterium SD302]
MCPDLQSCGLIRKRTISYLASSFYLPGYLVKTPKSPLLLAFTLLLLVGFSSCAGDNHPAEDFEVSGLDVSRYQAIVDWRAVKLSGVDFVFAKATEGGDHRDPLFGENWQELREQRIRRGAYHFFRPGISAELQAMNFIAQVGDLLPGDLPPVLDVEDRGGLTHDEFNHRLQSWLDLVEARYRIKPIIYSGQVFYNRHLAGRYTDYPVWIARYKDELPALADGRNFQFWQYGDTGKVPGITGPVDLNIFTGSHLEMVMMSIPANPLVSDPMDPMASNN